MSGACEPERSAFWGVSRTLAITLETNSGKPRRLSRAGLPGVHSRWREGIGFVIPSMGFSVTPYFSALCFSPMFMSVQNCLRASWLLLWLLPHLPCYLSPVCDGESIVQKQDHDTGLVFSFVLNLS